MGKGIVIKKYEEGSIRVELANGTTLVAEPCSDPENPGIALFVEDQGGTVFDTCVLESPEDEKKLAQELRLLVWGNPHEEDFTHEFPLKEYANGWDDEKCEFRSP